MAENEILCGKENADMRTQGLRKDNRMMYGMEKMEMMCGMMCGMSCLGAPDICFRTFSLK